MDTFVFVIVIISVITTMIIIYTLCKHNQIKNISAKFSTSTGKRGKSRRS